MNRSNGLIFAADIEERQDLLKIIQQVSHYIDAIKLGNVALYQNGWSIISEIKKITNIPIIADLKLMDIPEVAQKLTKAAINAGADGLMVCGITGGDTILDCRLLTDNKMLFVFTQFTNKTGLISKEMADEYIDLAMAIKCDGIQVPGTKPERIKEVKGKIGNKLIIISCGVGAQGPLYGSAIAAGADYEIIGRTIYHSKTPEIEAQRARDDIRNIVDKNTIKREQL